MLIAAEREFRAVHREAVVESLDELAPPLFGLADAPPDERVIALARAAWAALPDEGTAPQDWLFGCALEGGRATGAVRAALAAELGRRAGDRFRAQRASRLRLLLPLEDTLREQVQRDVHAYGGDA